MAKTGLNRIVRLKISLSSCSFVHGTVAVHILAWENDALVTDADIWDEMLLGTYKVSDLLIHDFLKIINKLT
jgi:hypothetical protein